MNTKEQIELCGTALMNLLIEERNGSDMTKHDPEITGLFPICIVLDKLEKTGIDVVIPDMILMILDICCLGNPGVIQLMTKELLMDIKTRQGGSIPKGYVVTADDFVNAYGDAFPLLSLPATEEKYHKLWEAQKKERLSSNLESDNQCDIPEWWQEIL